jgi:6-phosphogluconolactonase
MADLDIYPDADGLATAAAELFAFHAQAAIAARGRFVVALSGGSTPLETYRRLVTLQFSSQTDWLNIHLFWGDERCVPPDHPDSNYGQALRALIEQVPIPAPQVHRVRGELAPDAAALEYERELRAFFVPTRGVAAAEDWPRFDLVLLGMGADGHTASLFPGAAALHESTHWVVGYWVDAARGWRVTLTPPAINSSRAVAFLVSGADKAVRLKQVLTGPQNPDSLPAQIIRPTRGQCRWLIDDAAAAQL